MLATMTFFKLYKCTVKFFFQEQLTLVHLQLSSWYQILKWRQIMGQRAERRLFWFQFVQTSWLFCCWTTSSDSWQRHEEEDMKVNSNILNIIDELWLLPQICPVHQAWHQDEVTHSQRICGLKIKRNKPKVWLFQLSRKKKHKSEAFSLWRLLVLKRRTSAGSKKEEVAGKKNLWGRNYVQSFSHQYRLKGMSIEKSSATVGLTGRSRFLNDLISRTTSPPSRRIGCY